MKKTKLFKLLQSLNKKEFDQLELYLSSPFFLSKNADVLKLYLAIKKHRTEFFEQTTSKLFFYKLVYPAIPFEDLRMRHLLNKSVQLVDSYLLYLYNEKHKLEREIQVTKVYNERNIYKEFTKNTKRILKSLESKTIKDTKHYYNKYTLESNYIFHTHTNRKKEVEYFNRSIKSLHNYIAMEYLNIVMDINNVKRIFKVDINYPKIEYSKELTKENKSLKIRNLANELLLNGNEQKLKELRGLFEENLQFLSAPDKKDTFSVILNFAIQETTKNPTTYIPFIFNAYKMGIKHQLIFQNGEIRGNKYLNIVKIGIANKGLEWTRNFISEYEDKIRLEERAFTINSSKIFLYFAEEAYEKVIELISNVKLPEIQESINLRTILLRSFFKLYQQNKFNHKPLLSQLSSFERYLKRDSDLNATRKLKNKNFIKYLRKVIYYTERKKWNKKRVADLLVEIDSRNDVALSPWLKRIIKSSPNQ